MSHLLESLMYQASQVFLFPTLVVISLLFVYAFFLLGMFAMQWRQRRRARDGAPRWATQSGPMLLIAGRLHPGIQPDGASHYIRNGACVAPGGQLFFVISETKVSFGRFATAMRDGLACTDALYFDGAVSSLWAPALRRMDDRYALGPMVVVLVK